MEQLGFAEKRPEQHCLVLKVKVSRGDRWLAPEDKQALKRFVL